MAPDPTKIDRLRDQLAALQQLHHSSSSRAGDPPRLTTEAWRGNAYAMYAADADALALELTSVATQVARIEQHTRAVLAHALG